MVSDMWARVMRGGRYKMVTTYEDRRCRRCYLGLCQWLGTVTGRLEQARPTALENRTGAGLACGRYTGLVAVLDGLAGLMPPQMVTSR